MKKELISQSEVDHKEAVSQDLFYHLPWSVKVPQIDIYFFQIFEEIVQFEKHIVFIKTLVMIVFQR